LTDDDTKRLSKQSETIILLLGKIAFKKDEVREIVIWKKQKEKQEKYIEGYNACDGQHSLSEVSRIIGVVPGTLSPILKDWEDRGIIFEVEAPDSNKRTGGKFYRKILAI